MWKTVTLGDVLEVQNGYAFNSKQFSPDGEHGLIRIRDLKKGVNTETRYDGEYDEKYVVRAGDFLIGMDGEFRCYEWKGENALLNQRVCRLEGFSEHLFPRFLFYAINSKLKEIEDNTGFITVKHLSSKTITQISLSLPSLSEQQRIVEKLDAAFAEIDRAVEIKTQMQSDALKIFDNALADMFEAKKADWITVKLSEITRKIGSGATPKGGKGAYKEDGISLIRSMNVHDMRFKYKDLAKIDENQAQKLSNVCVEENDVLLNITGASVARCALVAEDVLPARVNQHVSIIRLMPNTINPKLLAYGLVSKPYKDRLLEVGDSGGATRQAITKKQIEEFEVSYPPNSSAQLQMVDKLNELYARTRELSLLYSEQLTNVASLKSVILSQELQPREAA
jgi:type I restriction enzyme, S subunit